MVYSTRYDKSADRQISDRTDRPSPDLFVPGRDLRYRSGIQQYRGMVVVDSRGRSAPQGSAVLSFARRKFGIGIRRLRLRAESFARRFRRADPAFAGRRDFRQGQIGRLPPTQPLAELIQPTNDCFVIAGSKATKQSSDVSNSALPAEPVIGRAFARPVGSRCSPKRKRRPIWAPFVCG